MLSENRKWIVIGGLCCGTAVALGAFGAHALEGAVNQWYGTEAAHEKLQSWETAVRYQFFHGVGVLLACLFGYRTNRKWMQLATICFVIGTVIFSGGLYGWVLSAWRPFVIIVPIGGISFLLGWCSFVIGAFRAFD